MPVDQPLDLMCSRCGERIAWATALTLHILGMNGHGLRRPHDGKPRREIETIELDGRLRKYRLSCDHCGMKDIQIRHDRICGWVRAGETRIAVP